MKTKFAFPKLLPPKTFTQVAIRDTHILFFVIHTLTFERVSRMKQLTPGIGRRTLRFTIKKEKIKKEKIKRKNKKPKKLRVKK